MKPEKVSAGYFDYFCSCSWNDVAELGVVAGAVSAAAACFFSAKYLAAGAFTLCASSVTYFLYSSDRAKVKELTDKMNQSAEQLRMSEQRIGTLTQQLTMAANTNRETQAQMSQNIQQLQLDNRNLEENIRNFDRERQRLNGSVSTLQQQNRQFITEANEWKQHCDDLTSQIKTLFNEYGLLTAQMTPLYEAVGKLAVTENGVITAAASVGQDLKDQFGKVSDLLKAWKSTAETASSQKKQLDGSLLELKETVEKTGQELSQLKEENRKLGQEAIELKSALEKWTNANDRLGKSLDAAAQDIEPLQRERKDLEERERLLQHKAETISKEREELTQTMGAAMGKIEQLTEQAKKLTEEIAEKQKQLLEMNPALKGKD